MKTSKLLCMAAAVLSAAFVYADEGDVLINFSTTHDTYADGTTVLDGEWYALVWSPDGAFGGITSDCGPARSGDEVVFVSPLAKNGKCPDVVFELARDKAHFDGVYQVYLIDTRNADNTAPAAAVAGARPVLNGAVASKDYQVSDVYGASAATATASSGSSTWAESVVDASQYDSEPSVAAFKVEDAKIKITVTGMVPGLKYNIRKGATVQSIETLSLEVPLTKTSEETMFVLDKDDAKFFKVVRQPLDNK